jgi:16S rRNA G966 N2-methylase RsmD
LSLEKLKDGGMVIVESDKPLAFTINGEVFDERKYGKCHLTFIRKEK